MIEKTVFSSMESADKVKINFKLSRMEVNEAFVEKNKNIEEYRSLVKNIVAKVFIEHIKVSVNSKLDNNIAFVNELGWSDILYPVDKCENPKMYFEQKYIQDAIKFSEKMTELAMELAVKNTK